MPTAADINDTLPLIVQLLLDKRLLESKQLDALREFQAKDNSPLEAILIKKGFASDHDIAKVYSEYLVVPIVDLPTDGPKLDPALARLIPEKLCRDQLIVPVTLDGETLEIAFVSPNEMLIVDEIQLLTGLTVRPLIAARSVVETLIEALYSAKGAGKEFMSSSEEFEQVEEDDGGKSDDDPADEILHLDQPPPPGRDGRVIRLVNQILEQALRAGASDIHLEPFEDSCKVRLRVDGVLHELAPPSRALFIPVVSRFKILAKMDIAEKRVPQDGAIALKSGDKRIDLRVNTVPTVYGEKMVMRILDKGAIPVQLTGLGFRRAPIEGPDRVDPVAARIDAGDRADRQRQEYHALRLPQLSQRARHQRLHGRGPGRVQVQGHEPGTGQGAGGPHVCRGAAGLSATGSRRDHGRRGARPGDGADLSARRVDRALRAFDDPHERLAFEHQPTPRYGHRALPSGGHASGA
jgi:hypothetical protein